MRVPEGRGTVPWPVPGGGGGDPVFGPGWLRRRRCAGASGSLDPSPAAPRLRHGGAAGARPVREAAQLFSTRFRSLRPGPGGKCGTAVPKTSMEPWAPAEPGESPAVLDEQLNLLPALDLRQEMPPTRMSKSFLSTNQDSPILSNLALGTPVLLPIPSDLALGTPVLPKPEPKNPASARFPSPPSPPESQDLAPGPSRAFLNLHHLTHMACPL